MPPDVLAGEEARDADCAAEEVVRHGHDPDGVAVEPGPSEQRAEARAEHLPRDERDGSPHRGPRPPRDRPGEAVLEPADQPDSVLDHRKPLVGAGGRPRPAGEPVDLVGEGDGTAAERGQPALLPALHAPAARAGPVRGYAPDPRPPA